MTHDDHYQRHPYHLTSHDLHCETDRFFEQCKAVVMMKEEEFTGNDA